MATVVAIDTSEVNNKTKTRVINQNLTLYESGIKGPSSDSVVSNTLVILFGWLLAKRDACEKYRNLYLSRGFDVLFVEGSLTHFAWPPGAVHASFELLQALNTLKHYRHFLVHSVSVGAYNYAMALMEVSVRSPRFNFFTNKLKGLVLDSVVIGSFSRILLGVSSAASESKALRSIMMKVMGGYFTLTRKHTYDIYEKTGEYLLSSPAEVPTLILASRDDPMSDPETVENLYRRWKQKVSLPVLYQMWDTGTHAALYRQHPEEYAATLDMFLAVFKEHAVKDHTISKL